MDRQTQKPNAPAAHDSSSMAVQNAINEERQAFRKIAEKLVHDVRSPLTSLQMILNFAEIPEPERTSLREAALRIQDITTALLLQLPGSQQKEPGDEESATTPLLLSVVLLDILGEKRQEYQEQNINFTYDFPENTWFVFVYIPKSEFKRLVSNLINNAVEALEPHKKDVALLLDLEGHTIDITVQDSGLGMAKDVQEKILRREVFTQGKNEQHHGLGLQQVFHVLDHYEGSLRMASRSGVGTQMIVRFPAAAPPLWAAHRIELHPDDMVIILDDEPTIHDAWRLHFSQKAPHMQLKYFTSGQETIDFIEGTEAEARQKIFLLADYELPSEDISGLDVIEKTQIERSLLVTAHHARYAIQRKAIQAGVRILPKTLASEVPIKILKPQKNPSPPKPNGPDLVLVDDDADFAKNILTTLEKIKIDYYESLESFFENLSLYPKDTKICLDRIFTFEKMDGIGAAKKLHGLGYMNLYLLTGLVLHAEPLPTYLKVIEKHKLDEIYALAESEKTPL